MMIPHNEITRQEKLGESRLGTVYAGIWDTCEVAIKILKLGKLPDPVVKEFSVDMSIMVSLHHPSIAHIYGVSNNKGWVSIITEFCPKGNLRTLLSNKNEKLPWHPERWRLAYDIAAGLRYLHGQKFPLIHRHLTPFNVLINKDNRAKISDCGLRVLEVQVPGTKKPKVVGELVWLAPELLMKKRGLTPAVDIYSFGIILWEMATRLTPWSELKGVVELAKAIHEGKRLPFISGTCPMSYLNIVKKCWAQDRKTRPTASKVFQLLRDARLTDQQKKSEKQ